MGVVGRGGGGAAHIHYTLSCSELLRVVHRSLSPSDPLLRFRLQGVHPSNLFANSLRGVLDDPSWPLVQGQIFKATSGGNLRRFSMLEVRGG